MRSWNRVRNTVLDYYFLPLVLSFPVVVSTDLHDVISVNPSLGLGPCHGGSAECTCLFLPPRHRPSPVHYRGRLPAFPRQNDFMTDLFFETAAIPLCSGPQVCSPPRSFPPLRLIVAGQPRLLRPSRTCFVASACIGHANHPPRQLVVWGLTPH